MTHFINKWRGRGLFNASLVAGLWGISTILGAFQLGCAAEETGEVAGGPGGTGGAGGAGGSGGSGGAPAPYTGLCKVDFAYSPPSGSFAQSVSVAGEWNDFSVDADVMDKPGGAGEFTKSIEMKPGLWAYKLVHDKVDWRLDPTQVYRKYVGGVENSAVRVPDCSLPVLEAESSQVGGSSFAAAVRYFDGVEKNGADLESVKAVLRHNGTESPVAVDSTSGDADPVFNFSLNGLEPGKYTLVITASDKAGRVSEPLRLVFWVEPEPFEWRDALIYMIMTDRFKNGDPSNDPAPTPGVSDARADFHGGDLEGVRQAIESGALDKLGVRAIWLTPFATNPDMGYLASDQKHLVSGYHGYWPIRAREVDPRLGGEAALRAMVTAAHKHGIRVLMDYVVNHVHQGHEYFLEHKEWFRTGCVCGTAGCDWTEHRLDCVFATYMPDVNYTVPEAAQQFVDDAIWWLDEFDLDGLRVDAVKHVEDVAIMNLSASVRREFEAAGTRYFLMGETAMGWTNPNDCGCNFDAQCSIDCNKSQYDTISQYIGDYKLDGQFDFVLYHAVPYRVFAYDEQGLAHADFWTKASLSTYPEGSVMTPYIGSHDTPRFVTLATYRGQDAAHDKGVAGNQWDNVAGPPDTNEPYSRHGIALAWLLGLPGAPLLYYGDEYGQFGGADPGNREDWRSDPAALLPSEAVLLARTEMLGTARRSIEALRRGGYETIFATDNFLAFARPMGDPKKTAIVAISRSGSASSTDVTLPASLNIAAGSVLADWMGGPDLMVGAGGTANISLSAWGSAIYVPK